MEMTNRVRVITAPNKFNMLTDNSITVFLAGGITNCNEWQVDVINEIFDFWEDNDQDFIPITLLNPRRTNFDVNDPNAEYEQISWEHRMLSKCDIISFFFDNSDSLQPITLYELGRWSIIKPTVISIVNGYKRQKDVLIQKGLDGDKTVHVYDTYDEAICEHAYRIIKKVKGL